MTDTSSFPESDSDGLWTYCLSLYEEPGIAAACIELQDHHGVDVDLLLYACWAAGRFPHALGSQDFNRLIDATETWQAQVTGTIRKARRALKDQAESLSAEAYQNLRKQLLDAELDAEKIELSRISALSPTPESGPSPDIDIHSRAEDNIRTYLACLNVAVDADIAAALNTIAAAAANIWEKSEG